VFSPTENVAKLLPRI